MLVFVLLCILCPFEFCKYLEEEERAGCSVKYGASYIGTISRSDSDFDETC